MGATLSKYCPPCRFGTEGFLNTVPYFPKLQRCREGIISTTRRGNHAEVDRFWNDVCVPGGNGANDDGGDSKIRANSAFFSAVVKTAAGLEMFGSL